MSETDNYPFVGVVNEAGDMEVMTMCVRVAECGSPPFLSDAQYTPSLRIEGMRRPLCRPCAEAVVAEARRQGKTPPAFDWERAYPSLSAHLGEDFDQ